MWWVFLGFWRSFNLKHQLLLSISLLWFRKGVLHPRAQVCIPEVPWLLKVFYLFHFLFAVAWGNEVIWLAQPFLVFSISTAAGQLLQVFKVNLTSLFKTTGRDVGRVWDVASKSASFLKAAITKPSIILKVILQLFLCYGPGRFWGPEGAKCLTEICINSWEHCFEEIHFILRLLCIYEFG